jgi:hypothetical protein
LPTTITINNKCVGNLMEESSWNSLETYVGDPRVRGSNHGNFLKYTFLFSFFISYLGVLTKAIHPPFIWFNAHCEKCMQVTIKTF